MLTTVECGDLALVTCQSERGVIADVESAFAELAEQMTSRGLATLHERIFGDCSVADEVLQMREDVRRRLGLDSGVRPTFVEGRPGDGAGVAGIHVIAARPAGSGASRRLRWRGEPCGRVVNGADATYLALSDPGRFLPLKERGDAVQETHATFKLVEEMLEASQWSFEEVRRTWFYLDAILTWYDDFNRVRNEVFSRLGFFNGQRSGVIPASTGILGRGASGRWCTVDLLAVRPREGKQCRVERMVNPSQNEAPEYGSAFSRGLEVAMGSARLLLVSGTASIDDSGRSVLTGDFEGQTERTLDTIAALLEPHGASLADIRQATAFVKNPDDVAAYHRIIERRGLESMRAVVAIGDVCRDELLFELDATALLPARGDSND
jgi:enamine deaminase RidA (YjgF/YER057c/UK114 family)